MSDQFNYQSKAGKLFVVSAPSGAGKTSLCKKLLKRYTNLKYSISHTTRMPRTKESEGEDYFFVEEQTFFSMIENKQFLEWAVVHGNYYGTSRNFILENLESGYDIVLDIDPQGARTLKEKLKFGTYIFITAPSLKELENRLKARRSESEERINKRLQNAVTELKFLHNYDYLILNRDFKKAFCELESIYIAEHLKTEDIVNIENIMNLED